MAHGVITQIYHIPSDVVPGEPFTLYYNMRNDGETGVLWWKLYRNEAQVQSGEMVIPAGQGFGQSFHDARDQKTTYKVEIGHLEGGEPILDDTRIYILFEELEEEICIWIEDHGGPSGLTITDVFEIIDSYLYETPPSGYTFIPTLQNVFGVIDYYLGFDGDAATGCDFFP